MIRYRFYRNPPSSFLPDLNRLLMELDPTSPVITPKSLRLVSAFSHLLLAVDSRSGTVVGMATLAVSHKFSAPDYGSLEDIVVDSQFRGRGIGRELTARLIQKARQLKLHHLELTSNPSRTAANYLYQSLGFFLRNTNCYRLNLSA
jgi:ribosomal protein S18 acetylase RimI-like enzyme